VSRLCFHSIVISRTTVARETARLVRRQSIRSAEEVRTLRLDAGVSLRELSAVTGLHPSYLARIEAAERQASVEALTAIGIALGAELSIKYFAGSGPRLIDRFQLAMVDAFVRALDSRWSVRLEVPVTKPARGVVDAVLADRTASLVVASEFQSEFRRLEQQIRWNNEKADGLAARLDEEATGDRAPSVSQLLVLRSTTATREVARRYEAVLRVAYPARAVDLVNALTTPDASWPGPGMVWMRLEKGKADLLDGPPRGVRLGH
jgi:transcriptional regulator with XRE-family HTH domain